MRRKNDAEQDVLISFRPASCAETPPGIRGCLFSTSSIGNRLATGCSIWFIWVPSGMKKATDDDLNFERVPLPDEQNR
jgi:hypothetical protein